MDNLHIYNQVRSVPVEAKKTITGGRLNGKTDINPMWRIMKLTQLFGVVGIGWRYEITRQWIETSEDETAAFCNINLYIKQGDIWSEAIPGTGGSMFVSKERNGKYTSDECYKMALTDALSVACKAIGVAADVYWDKDPTKYDSSHKQGELPFKEYICSECSKPFVDVKDPKSGKIVTAKYQYDHALKHRNGAYCKECYEKLKPK